jgi:hypothetical protein
VTRVLLITGARSLADDPAAEAWARVAIAEALRDVDLLIVGDAPGPDTWAWEIAGNLVVDCDEYLTRGPHAGMISEHRGIGAPTVTRRWAAADTHPLRRNIVMVNVAKEMWEGGDDVHVLALLDGRKDSATGRVTRGTEHTVGLARAAGLTVTEKVWGKK